MMFTDAHFLGSMISLRGGSRLTGCSPWSIFGSLNMNLADRFFRVVKANLNSIISNLEDPEKVRRRRGTGRGADQHRAHGLHTIPKTPWLCSSTWEGARA
jgi:hypothetical protein